METPRPRRRIGALLAALGTALAVASSASAATSVGSDVSSNWAGYVVSAGYNQTTGAAGSYSNASGSWVQPAASCASCSRLDLRRVLGRSRR